MGLRAQIREFIRELREERGTSSYDTTARVRRVEDGKAWIEIPGGVPETPADMDVDAKRGDVVQARVGGGRAWLTGNKTDPPASTSRVKEVRKIASSAGKKAVQANVAAEKAREIAMDARGGNVTSVVIEYCLADENAIPEGGTFEDIQYTDWSEEVPEYEDGKYYWSRIITTYEDGSVTEGEPIFALGLQASAEASIAANNAANAANTAKNIANNAKAVADTKKRTFNSQPEPPYDLNDVWYDGAHGTTKLCIRARSTGNYDASDWTVYFIDVSDHFWYDSSGAHVAENAGDVTTGCSQTIASAGTVMMRNGKLVTSWTGSDSQNAALNFYDCSSASAKDADLVASYSRSGITQYINNKSAMALTASALTFFSPNNNHYTEAIFGSSACQFYSNNVLRSEVNSTGLKVYDSSGNSVAEFGSTVYLYGRDSSGNIKSTVRIDSTGADVNGFKIATSTSGGVTYTWCSSSRALYLDGGAARLTLASAASLDVPFTVGGLMKAYNVHEIATAVPASYNALTTSYAEMILSQYTSDGSLVVGNNLEIVPYDEGYSYSGIKCKKAGHVVVMAQVFFDSTNDTNVCMAKITNGSTDVVIAKERASGSAGDSDTMITLGPKVISVSANDIIHVYAKNASSGVGYFATSNKYDFLTVQYV